MFTQLKYLQVGLGSMGKRRIRNLLTHNIPRENIVGFDLSQIRCTEVVKEYGVQTFSNFQDAIKICKPDIFIISTPPHLHMEYCLRAVKENIHFFVEISTLDKGYTNLIHKIEQSSLIGVPSCTYRFFTPITMMKSMIAEGKIGKVQAFLHHCGQYLPDWHPWESYKDFYVSRKESSALKEMFLYELCWISWLTDTTFTKISGVIDKVSDLDMKIPDIYGSYVSSKNHVTGSIFIDVISRKPFRTIRILGSEGTLEWHLQQHTIELYEAKTKRMSTISVPQGKKRSEYAMADETMYENEIKAFLDAIDGQKSFPYSFAEDKQLFTLLKKLEKNY